MMPLTSRVMGLLGTIKRNAQVRSVTTLVCRAQRNLNPDDLHFNSFCIVPDFYLKCVNLDYLVSDCIQYTAYGKDLYVSLKLCGMNYECSCMLLGSVNDVDS